jgi:hypothetical protein
VLDLGQLVQKTAVQTYFNRGFNIVTAACRAPEWPPFLQKSRKYVTKAHISKIEMCFLALATKPPKPPYPARRVSANACVTKLIIALSF